MCAGKDESKPHLHYTAAARSIAIRLEPLTGLLREDILELVCAIGLNALCDELYERCKQEAGWIDIPRLTRLMATKEAAVQAVAHLKQRHEVWVADPIKGLRLDTEELPF